MKGGIRVGVGTKFAYDGETLTIIELFPAGRGNEVLVEDRGGKRRYWLTLRELLASGRAIVLTDQECSSSDDPVELAGVVLSNLDAAARAVVAERAGHVREVLTGYKSGSAELGLPGEPQLEYAPGTKRTKRYEAKARELGLRKRTIERWVRAYRDHGEAGLVQVSQSNPAGRTDRRWLLTATEVMVENAHLSRPSRKSVIEQTRARLAVRHGAGVVPVPSRATVYRRLDQLDRQVPTFQNSRQRNRDVAGRPQAEYGKLRPSRPGEYLVMDSTRLDVFALDPVTLKWVCVELTVAMDWYTRCVTALRLTPLSTKAMDVASLIFRTYRPNRAPDDWPSHAVWPEHGIPRVVFPDVDGLDGNKEGIAHPAIVPETLVIDHGKAFESQHINSVCQRMGISIQPARLRTGRDKGVVERFFRTLREDLLQVLPGYKGPDIYSRGVSPESDAFFYIDELEQIVREWVAVVYHHRPHESLYDPGVPGYKMSPAERFQHGIERAGYIEAPADPDLAFEFLRPVRRKILHYGVQYQGRRYNGPALNGYRDKDSPYQNDSKRLWYIHVNPDDVTRVYFRDPFDRTWHTLWWEHAPSLDMPMSEDALRFARRLAAARGAPSDPLAAMKGLLERWNLGMGNSLAERRIALRLAREQAELFGELSTADEASTLASLEAHRAAVSADGGADAGDASGAVEPDDDIDEFAESDNSDETDDEFYADAFEDE
jgi:transposase InsO family protein